MSNSTDVPNKEQLLADNYFNPLEWGAVYLFTKNTNQPEESFEKQTLSITTCVNYIESYWSALSNSAYKELGV